MDDEQSAIPSLSTVIHNDSSLHDFSNTGELENWKISSVGHVASASDRRSQAHEDSDIGLETQSSCNSEFKFEVSLQPGSRH